MEPAGVVRPRNAVADAFEEQALVELHGMLRPAEDLALYRAEMAEWPGVDEVPYWLEGQAEWVRANDDFRRDLLDELRRDGPLPVARAARHLHRSLAVVGAGTTTATSR